MSALARANLGDNDERVHEEHVAHIHPPFTSAFNVTRTAKTFSTLFAPDTKRIQDSTENLSHGVYLSFF